MVRRMNRYAQKRKHKREMKKKFGRGLYTGHRTNLRLHENECREEYSGCPNARNGGYTYWKSYYLTGPRRYAKFCTNRMIRAMYRDMLRRMSEDDMDDICAFTGSDYEKAFDYDWTIW